MKKKTKVRNFTFSMNQAYGNLYGIYDDMLGNLTFLSKIVRRAAKDANLSIVDVISRKFPGSSTSFTGGASVVAILKESHIVLHTWPEFCYATLDVCSCGVASKPDVAFEYIVRKLKPKKYSMTQRNR